MMKIMVILPLVANLLKNLKTEIKTKVNIALNTETIIILHLMFVYNHNNDENNDNITARCQPPRKSQH